MISTPSLFGSFLKAIPSDGNGINRAYRHSLLIIIDLCLANEQADQWKAGNQAKTPEHRINYNANINICRSREGDKKK
jgi:hypothetical protein